MSVKNNSLGSTKFAKNILKAENAIVGTMRKKGQRNIRSVSVKSVPMLKVPKKFRSFI